MGPDCGNRLGLLLLLSALRELLTFAEAIFTPLEDLDAASDDLADDDFTVTFGLDETLDDVAF